MSYPSTGPRPFIDCPVHDLAVSLDLEGRINSSCPECVREADLSLPEVTSQRKGNGRRLTPTGEALPDGDHATAVRWPFTGARFG